MTDPIPHSNEKKPNEASAQAMLDPWVANAQATNNADYIAAHRALAAYIKPFITGPVLDIGCGNGVFLNVLKEMGIEKKNLFGTDLAGAHVELSKENTGLSTIKQANASRPNGIPFQQKFTVILALNWLHVPPQNEDLNHYYAQITQQIATVAAPGALVVYDLAHTASSADTLESSATLLHQCFTELGFEMRLKNQPLYMWKKPLLAMAQ